jgi:predicted ATPase
MSGVYPSSIIRFTDESTQNESYPELCFVKRFFSEMEVMNLLSPANMKGLSQGKSMSIGSGGEKLGAFVKSLSDDERRNLARDVQKFCPSFSAIVPNTKRYGWVQLKTREVFGDKTIEISAPNVSDGTMRIVALCSIRYLKSGNSAVLLDEIEDGVNNEHFEVLVDFLREISREKNMQIIATTHSSVLLDYWIKNVNPEAMSKENERDEAVVYLCRNENGYVEAYNLFNSDQILEKLGYLFPGEIVQSMTNKQLQELLRGETKKK